MVLDGFGSFREIFPEIIHSSMGRANHKGTKTLSVCPRLISENAGSIDGNDFR
jgi:hypothetical protein